MRPQELLMNTTTRRPDQPKMVPLGGAGSKQLEEVGQPLMDRAEFNNIYEIHRKARSLGWNPTKYDPDESKLASLAMSNQIPELDNSFLFKAILNMKQNNVPPTIYKGYLSIKNPMLLDDGTWTAEDFFTDYTMTKVADYFYKRSSQTIMDEIVQRVASETGQSLDSIKNSPAYLDMEQSASRTKDFTDLLSEDIEPGDFGDFGGFNQFDMVNQVYLDLQRASTNRKFVEFLESYGYDGIAYPNKAEPAFADDEEILSYIPFRPEQFKLESAFDFDVDDPRMFMAEGGVIQHLIRKGDTLSKISKDTGVSVADLVRLNNIKNPNLIRAGDKLILGTAPENVSDKAPAAPKREEPPKVAPRSGIRRASVRRSVAGPQDAPAESRSLLSRLGQSFSDAKNALITETIPINIRAFVSDLTGDDSKITERDLSAKEQEALKRIALQTQAKDKSVIEYADYQTDANNKTQYVDVSPSSSNIDVVGKTATSPEYALKTTLGQAKITTDDEGNTIIIDRYNFNDAKDDFKFDEFMDSVVNAGFSGYAQARNLARYFGSGQGEGAEVEINLGKLNPKEVGTVAMLTANQGRTQSAKGGKIDKKKMDCNKPKRTPNHPKKSHVVKACKDGKEKIIRFGEQGAKTAGKPKAGESKRMKAKRKSFKARHGKNIKKGNMSAAYWADKVKW